MTDQELLRKLFSSADELELSDRQLGEISGLGHSSISYIRAGKRHPGLKTFAKLAEAVGCRILLSRTQE